MRGKQTEGVAHPPQSDGQGRVVTHEGRKSGILRNGRAAIGTKRGFGQDVRADTAGQAVPRFCLDRLVHEAASCGRFMACGVMRTQKCTPFIPNIKRNDILSCGMLEYDVNYERIAVGTGRPFRPGLFLVCDYR